MFKIEKNKILVNRGDFGIIDFRIPIDKETDYTFEIGDVISFGVYPTSQYEKNPLIYKEITIEEDGVTSVQIVLESEDTRIGPIINKPVQYWYEIQLNKEQTVLGYDKNGPKIFMLYPEGSEI